jgi:hypothetical protein
MPTLPSVTEIVSGTSPMPPMLADSQAMALMPTDSINLTDDTEESGRNRVGIGFLGSAGLPTYFGSIFVSFSHFCGLAMLDFAKDLPDSSA